MHHAAQESKTPKPEPKKARRMKANEESKKYGDRHCVEHDEDSACFKIGTPCQPVESETEKVCGIVPLGVSTQRVKEVAATGGVAGEMARIALRFMETTDVECEAKRKFYADLSAAKGEIERLKEDARAYMCKAADARAERDAALARAEKAER